ncbi:hypothetical protein BQ9231_00133 [Cedratvirus lausannensis]|uniref:Uncharacterized protein n=1 Tax=Cedratvirus lausannensis TaxID=2023205 RepID=A0A285PXX9_9VIRU|nr:hypothetical protein BQ9231_00133 [Cedratvirus lausannensis]
MAYTYSPFSVFLVGDVMHVSWPHQGARKEDLYIELCNTTIHISDRWQRTLCVFAVSVSHDCDTLKVFYLKDHLLFTIEAQTNPPVRRIFIEN